MRTVTRRTLLVVALSATATLLSVLPGSAVPMWSRRYGVPCTACHAYPSLQLNANGLDFFRRGHRFQGDTTDKDLTHLISAHGEWEQDYAQGQSTAFTQPELHLHAGGAFSDHFSTYADANVNSDFESLYLQYTSSGDGSYFTARAGKISPTIIRDYANGIMAAASTPLIITDPTLGSDPFTPARDSYGVDVAGRIHSFFLEGGVVNGDEAPGQASVNNHKDVYASAEAALPDGISGVGLYYYRGGYDLGDPSAGPLLFDRYDRKAVFANYTRDRFRLAGAYLSGTDSVETLADRKLSGYYVQGDVQPVDVAVPFVRWEHVRTEDETGVTREDKGTIGCSLRIFENDLTAGRVVLEASRVKLAGVTSNAGLINLLWAF